MKKNSVILILYSIILALFSICTIVFFNNSVYINLTFFVVSGIVFLILFHLPRNKGYLTSYVLRLTIISLFSYLIINYALGIITGFGKNFFGLNFSAIFERVLISTLIIISSEIIRFIFAQNSKFKKYPLVLITISLFIYECFQNINFNLIGDYEYIFIMVCTVIIPLIAKEILYSYIAFNIGIIPNILIRFTFEPLFYMLPIIPSLGNYLNGVIGLLYPTILFLSIKKVTNYYNKENKYIRNVTFGFILIPIIIILITIVILVSGVLRYKMVAIASGSMSPVFERGDAVIYDQTFKPGEIENGTVIAFENNLMLITHRIIDIIYLDGEYSYKTKGDFNEFADSYIVEEKDLRGVVKYTIPYIGFPTLWFNDLFN